MSSRWVPKWEIQKIEINNREESICYDTETKLYACPKCGPECLKGGIPRSSSYFFNKDDLINHFLAHKYLMWEKKKPKEIEEEEEEEEDEE
ncbi:MAG: hypothetical protein QXR57_00710 [Metallosphaera sp.]|uniref:hypothetical protein n=1 Tax=Metallosphaera sp. TaxID=2020860 RepID=UPI0031644386